MFKKRSLLTLALVFIAVGLTVYQVFYVSKRNKKNYHKTLEYLQPTKTHHTGTTQRNLVTKNLWRKEEDSVYQYIISSAGSTLHLNQLRARETRITEEMNKAICLLQQKKYFVNRTGVEVSPDEAVGPIYPMQQVCRLEVDYGTYHYSSKKFLGQIVKIQIYEIPGHELSASPSFKIAKKVLEGECDHIHFYFIEKMPNLKVTNLVATLFGKEDSL